MILFIHILVGAAILFKMRNIFFGILLAFLSHYLIDLLPHSEYSVKNILKGNEKESLKEKLKLLLDITFGFILLLIFSDRSLKVFIGGFLGTLPDAFIILNLKFPQNYLLEKERKFHRRLVHFLKYKKIPLAWKIVSQGTAIVISLLILSS